MCVCAYLSLSLSIYIYIHTCVYIYIYTHITMLLMFNKLTLAQTGRLSLATAVGARAWPGAEARSGLMYCC